MSGDLERRSIPVELRSTTANRISGYAIVYGERYDVGGGPDAGGFAEVIAPGAASAALRRGDDVRLLVNHDGLALARTKSGTLTLSEDSHGLRVQATLDATNPTAQAVLSALRRGDVDQMSFAFRVPPGGQRWDSKRMLRTITDLQLHDVSVVTYPANPATSVAAVRAAQMPAATPQRRCRFDHPNVGQLRRAMRYGA